MSRTCSLQFENYTEASSWGIRNFIILLCSFSYEGHPPQTSTFAKRLRIGMRSSVLRSIFSESEVLQTVAGDETLVQVRWNRIPKQTCAAKL